VKTSGKVEKRGELKHLSIQRKESTEKEGVVANERSEKVKRVVE